MWALRVDEDAINGEGGIGEARNMCPWLLVRYSDAPEWQCLVAAARRRFEALVRAGRRDRAWRGANGVATKVSRTTQLATASGFKGTATAAGEGHITVACRGTSQWRAEQR